MTNKFYCIAVIENPIRFKSRYELYENFRRHIVAAGIKLVVVELAFGDRPHRITYDEDKSSIQLRSSHELWHKENLINIAISRLPSDWQYVAWIDADVMFTRPDWANETVQQLQHFQVVQMFSEAQDLSPTYEPMKTVTGLSHKGFIYSHLSHRPLGYEDCGHEHQFGPNHPVGKKAHHHCYASPYWHPGFAWAARREAIEALGGLFEVAILGASDHHMAWAFFGKCESSIPEKMHPNYKKALQIWQDRATKHIRKDVGFVPGLLLHYWHGKKKDRQYETRWKILTQNQFDPELDLKKDSQGVLSLTDRNIALRLDIERYLRTRNEDSIDL